MTYFVELQDIQYKITYGPEDEKHRKSQLFSDEQQSINFFNEQQALGKHVDAYKVTTTIRTEKIT